MMKRLLDFIKRLFLSHRKSGISRPEAFVTEAAACPPDDIKPGIEKEAAGGADELEGPFPRVVKKERIFGDGGAQAEREKQRSVTIEPTPVYLNVGLDYGTSTTKAAYRDMAEDSCFILPIRDTTDPTERYELPSTLVIRNGRIFFGLPGVEIGEGEEIVRSLKVCLACRPDRKYCTEGRKIDNRIDCEGKTISITGKVLAIDRCVGLFLGYTLKRVGELLERFYPSDNCVRRLSYVVSAPIESMEEKSTLDSFHRAVDLGLKLAKTVQQGMDFENAVTMASNIELRDSYDPDDTRRSFQIRPEAIAAIMPLLSDRASLLDDGLYAVVDVGAGTTDASYFRLAKFPEQTVVSLYNVHSAAVGGDRLDWSIFNLLDGAEGMDDNGRNRWLQTIRNWKKSMTLGGEMAISLDGHEKALDHRRITDALWRHGDDVREVLTRAFQKSYPKERRDDIWRNQKMFIVGGGAQLKQVESRLRSGPESINCTVTVKQIPGAGGMGAPGCMKHEADEGGEPDKMNYLFQVVRGLSYHPMSAPNIKLPSSVEEFAPGSVLEEARKFDPAGTDWWRDQD